MTRWFVFATIAAGGICGAGMHARAQVRAPEVRPASTIQQVMQAILFPNANVIFAAQRTDPATFPRDVQPSSSTNPLTGVYGGWQAVENSGLALAEAADLLNVKGRVCSNGKTVPVEDVDWKTAVGKLRDSAIAATAAARARNRSRVSEVADEVAIICSDCHRIYRVRGNPCVLSR